MEKESSDPGLEHIRKETLRENRIKREVGHGRMRNGSSGNCKKDPYILLPLFYPSTLIISPGIRNFGYTL